MKVLMVSVGSRGDTEPYCALSKELLKRDHVVHLFLQSNLQKLARPLKEAYPNFHAHALPFTNQDFYLASRSDQRGQKHPDARMKNVEIVANIICQLVLPCVDQILPVAEQSNALITCALARPLCLIIARSLKIKTIILHLQPLLPNRVFPNYRVSKTSFIRAILAEEYEDGDALEYPEYEETYWKLERALEEFYLRDRLKELKLGMTPIPWPDLQQILSGHNAQFFVVNSYSNHLIPSIQDTKSAGPYVYDIGPLADSYLPPDFVEPKSLMEFFESCPQKPLCIGFGSMPFRKVEIILESIQLLDQKAVLVGENLQIPKSYPHDEIRSMTYQVTSIPYSFLLPFCSMMLCHGGAGVVQACLRAGIPCLISPIMGDQFSFASLVEAKGLGVQCGTNLSTISSEEIFVAVNKAAKCMDICARLGARIRSESNKKTCGAQKLVDLLEETITSLHSCSSN